MFDSGGSERRLRACPLLGMWRTLRFGRFTLLGLDKAAAFFGRKDDLGLNLQERDT